MPYPKEYPTLWARYHWKTSKATRERKLLQDALRQTGGNAAAAARLMGISRSTVSRKIRQHGLLDAARPQSRGHVLKHALEAHFEHRFSVRTRQTRPPSYAVRWSNGPTIEDVIGYASQLEGLEGLSLHPRRECIEHMPHGDRAPQASACAPEQPPRTPQRVSCQLARLLNIRGLPQQQLSQLSGVHRDVIRRLVYDNWNGIHRDTIERLCRALGISPSDLFAWGKEGTQ